MSKSRIQKAKQSHHHCKHWHQQILVTVKMLWKMRGQCGREIWLLIIWSGRHLLTHHGSGCPEILVHTLVWFTSQVIDTSKVRKSKRDDVSTEEHRMMQNGKESVFSMLKKGHEAKLLPLKPGKCRERSISLESWCSLAPWSWNSGGHFRVLI